MHTHECLGGASGGHLWQHDEPACRKRRDDASLNRCPEHEYLPYHEGPGDYGRYFFEVTQ